MSECTTIDKPFNIYDADQHRSATDTFDTPSGVLVCSIDNMPAQMPTEASSYFGDLLLPWMDDIVRTRTHVHSALFTVASACKQIVVAAGTHMRRGERCYHHKSWQAYAQL
jgi:alpha-aminoadipic semialdehyde synthase